MLGEHSDPTPGAAKREVGTSGNLCPVVCCSGIIGHNHVEDVVSRTPVFSLLGVASLFTLGGQIFLLCTIDDPADTPWPTRRCQITSVAERDGRQIVLCHDGTAANGAGNDSTVITGQTITISQDPKTGKWEIGQEYTMVDNPLAQPIWNGIGINIIAMFCLFGIASARREGDY